MSEENDIESLFKIIDQNPSEYQEIVRDEDLLQSRKRWPLIAEIQSVDPLAPPAVRAGEKNIDKDEAPVIKGLKRPARVKKMVLENIEIPVIIQVEMQTKVESLISIEEKVLEKDAVSSFTKVKHPLRKVISKFLRSQTPLQELTVQELTAQELSAQEVPVEKVAIQKSLIQKDKPFNATEVEITIEQRDELINKVVSALEKSTLFKKKPLVKEDQEIFLNSEEETNHHPGSLTAIFGRLESSQQSAETPSIFEKILRK
jgi:hypothetical protein